MFLNVVLDDAVEESEKGERTNIGQIVSCALLSTFLNVNRSFEGTRW